MINLERLVDEMKAVRDELPLKAVVNSRLRNHGEAFEDMAARGLAALKANDDIGLQLVDFSRDLSALEVCRRY